VGCLKIVRPDARNARVSEGECRGLSDREEATMLVLVDVCLQTIEGKWVENLS
jgi:hypothetical protein